MVTRGDINEMLWKRLKALADNGTIPIMGKVYNGERDLDNVSEDITVKTTVVTGFGNVQRADVNINVFVNDMQRSANVYVADGGRLAVLSKAVLAFIKTIDYFTPHTGTVSVSEHVFEEATLRQHYTNFLVSMNVFDTNP